MSLILRSNLHQGKQTKPESSSSRFVFQKPEAFWKKTELWRISVCARSAWTRKRTSCSCRAVIWCAAPTVPPRCATAPYVGHWSGVQSARTSVKPGTWAPGSCVLPPSPGAGAKVCCTGIWKCTFSFKRQKSRTHRDYLPKRTFLFHEKFKKKKKKSFRLMQGNFWTKLCAFSSQKELCVRLFQISVWSWLLVQFRTCGKFWSNWMCVFKCPCNTLLPGTGRGCNRQRCFGCQDTKVVW